MSEGPLPPWLDAGSGVRGIGRYLDHTLLKPEATRAQILTLCDEGIRYGVKAVCVNGAWADLCAERLSGSGVALAVVVGFPLGAMAPATKADETRRAVAERASEIDMVIALGAAKAGEWQAVEDDIRGVVQAAGPALVKCILETGALEPSEIARACEAAAAAGAAFVKTSTGFHPSGGATEQAVSLMRRAVGTGLGVKASGGIRTPVAAIRMLAAGANRIGTSATDGMADWLGPAAPPLAQLFEGV